MQENTNSHLDQINEKFLEEYVSEDAVQKYTTATAGFGINYLLHHDYANVYLSTIKAFFGAPKHPLRLLEFGCGGGMNIITLVSLLEQKGVPVECAYGTDFSPRLVESARHEAKAALAPELASKLSFHVGRNEKLLDDLSAAWGKQGHLEGFFDLIIGVNTFRYCHRLGKSKDCAADIRRMLQPGGACINIDMNNRFPAFRSRFSSSADDPTECYIPTLDEYAEPFQSVGFEIVRKQNFCWIPHSAGRMLTFSCLLLSPFLNLVASSRAMRSLVVARKPI